MHFKMAESSLDFDLFYGLFSFVCIFIKAPFRVIQSRMNTLAGRLTPMANLRDLYVNFHIDLQWLTCLL